MSNYNHQPYPVQGQHVQAQKDVIIAYVLWFFLGQLGVHKFYLKQNMQGFLYLGAGVLGWATAWILIGWLLLVPLYIALIIDLFTMPARVQKINSGGVL